MSKEKRPTPKQVADRIEKVREELHELREEVAPAGAQAHEDLYAVLKEADRVLDLNTSLGVFLNELRERD